MPVATADTGKLLHAAMTALGRLWRSGYRYKKAGVMLLDLVDADGVASGLFDQPDDGRSLARMAAIDALNVRFGRGTVGYGSVGERQRWTLRRDHISQRYTTSWDELLRV